MGLEKRPFRSRIGGSTGGNGLIATQGVIPMKEPMGLPIEVLIAGIGDLRLDSIGTPLETLATPRTTIRLVDVLSNK